MENPITDFELSMPDDLILSESLAQINGTSGGIYGSKNYVDVFERKHLIQEYKRETDGDENDPEAVNHQREIQDDLYGSIIRGMRDIGILLDTNGSGDIIQNLSSLYDMFIVRRHQNLVEFIIQYILDNKTSLAAQFPNDSITNMTVKSARKTFRNKVEATIAIHCSEIVQGILMNDDILHPERMLELLYSKCPEDYEYLQAHSMFQVCALSFDVPTFVSTIRAIYNDPVNAAYLSSNVIEQITELFVSLNVTSQE